MFKCHVSLKCTYIDNHKRAAQLYSWPNVLSKRSYPQPHFKKMGNILVNLWEFFAFAKQKSKIRFRRLSL